MKILFYIGILCGGGAERVIVNLANFFSEDGNETLIINSYPAEDQYKASESVRRVFLEDKHLKKSFIRKNLSYVKKLRKILKEEKPDVLVSFMAEPNFRSIIAARKLKVKTVISVRNDPKKEYPTFLYRFLARRLYKRADGIVFQTDEAMQFFSEKIRKKSAVIMNSVDPVFFNTQKTAEDYCVAVGRLTAQKNYPMMIKAFRNILEDFPDKKLFIYGEGELKDSIYNLIIEEGVAENIKIAGRTDNVPDVLSRAEVFLMTSDYEGMPNALLEAMAAGVPVICTDCPCGGPKMVIEDGINGFLIGTGDSEALTEKLKIIFSDSELKRKLSDNAKLSAKNFLPDIINAKWQEYLENIVSDIEVVE